MGNFSNNEYVKKNITKDWLLSNGFRYSRTLSDEDTEVFTYRFPIYKYEGFIILECELRVILGENKVFIDVYDHNTINKYAPFYYSEYGDYSIMLKEIWIKINKELKKLNIINVKNEEGCNGSKNQKTKRKRNNTNQGKQRSSRI